MRLKKCVQNWNLYQKFAFAMIALGLFPMLILSTVIINRMLEGQRDVLQTNYKQAAFHAASSVENMLSVYDNASKLCYQYNFGNDTFYENNSNYDNLRKVLSGERYEPEQRETMRQNEMQSFLRSVENSDNYIYAVHFLTQQKEASNLHFHFSLRNTYFRDVQKLIECVDFENWNKISKELELTPPHDTSYYGGLSKTVFTVARNYFDLRNVVGQEKYVGTLFMDIDIEKLRLIFKKLHLQGGEEFYLINENGDCFFSTEEDCIGINLNLQEKMPVPSPKQMVIETKENSYGLKVVASINTEDAFAKLYAVRNTMYVVLGVAVCLLTATSVYFSRRMTKPIHNMMEQMSKVESGEFDICLSVESRDEIGILSERFNQMSKQLKSYINQSYVAQIRQNEAELTALKSQIYPHFLYNTLEIIRMTAVENEDHVVSQMIESLSEQIHYLIGPMQDTVPLEKEIDIVRKYVYLLNCRIQGKIMLSVNALGSANLVVPKLILQPIVENAYVHGIKPKNGRGSIMIEAEEKEGILILSVMDNGIGMNNEMLEKQRELLNGDQPGIKNEYNWQSIGLKNVHDRIRFLYGEQYGIKITSTAGIGTIVQAMMPVRRGEKNAEYDLG